MTDRSTISQSFYPGDHPPITLECVNLSTLSQSTLDGFLATVNEELIGIAAGYSDEGALSAFALSSESHVLLITLEESWESGNTGKQLLHIQVLRNSSYKKYGWNIARLATALHTSVDLRIKMAFDIQHKSTKHQIGSIAAVNAILDIEDMQLVKEKVADIFINEVFASDVSSKENLALRAWAGCKVGMLPRSKSTIRHGSPMDTTSISAEAIEFLAKPIQTGARIQSLKPVATRNDVEMVSTEDGLLHITSLRYKNRIRKNQDYDIELVDGKKIKAHAEIVEGKTAKLSLSENIEISSIVSVHVIGREELSVLELQRQVILSKAIRNPDALMRIPFVQMIWMPSQPVDEITWPQSSRTPLDEPLELDFDTRDLNNSQEEAVKHALSRENQDRITIITGPPGTGKTTVIAATVISIMNGTEDETIWIVAQSNVAVKNIAEKLWDCEFTDFKLLVSKEFSFQWHDHLYIDIVQNVITSDSFGGSKDENEALLGGARVMLCTLSTLSNKNMRFTELVPLTTLIIDEASQIEVGDYLPLFSRSASSLEKLVFFGDPKQLAPFGQDEVEDLQSIFEMPHLRQNEIFLDTQYRMPHFIGEFISEHVYDGQLNTTHPIASKLACRFVDVRFGFDEHPPEGNSWINREEVWAVVLVAKKFKTENRKYRVLTPYEAQRDMIEKALQEEGLKWEDTVFNVDSFQGNEEDHVIISLVRSNKLGFLKNERRTNVMLSRCRRSMLICTSKRFLLRQEASNSLVGRLAKHCMDRSGEEEAWINWDKVKKGAW